MGVSADSLEEVGRLRAQGDPKELGVGGQAAQTPRACPLPAETDTLETFSAGSLDYKSPL